MQIIQPAMLLAGAQSASGVKTFSGTLVLTGTLQQATTSAEQITGNLRTTSTVVNAAANNYASAAAGAIVLTLPTASAGSNCRIMFTKTDASANTVTIAAAGGDNIAGAANYVLNAQYQTVTLISVHSQLANTWVILGKS